MTTDVYIIDVLWRAISAMRVQIYGKPVGNFFNVNFNPGNNAQIVRALEARDGTTIMGEKYPLAAVVMPFTIVSGSGFYEVTFSKIVFAYMSQTAILEEPVLQKYELSGNFKTVLYPCVNEFIRRIAWSTSTNMGDPEAYSFTLREIPGQQLTKDSISNDFVDVIEILNLKATIFSQIKTCK